MGLGGAPDEWDDYEWFPSASASAAVPRSVASEADDLVARVAGERLWPAGDAPRILLVDLDNLRAGPARWKSRMAVVVALAREADHAVLAGQAGAATRARKHLAEFAEAVLAVPSGSDLADVALLDAVDDLDIPDARILVMSNDGIFAELAGCGPLVVLSPGSDALSDLLAASATRVVDLAALEREVSAALTA